MVFIEENSLVMTNLIEVRSNLSEKLKQMKPFNETTKIKKKFSLSNMQ